MKTLLAVALILLACLPASALEAAPDLLPPTRWQGESDDSVPVAPIVATAAAGGLLAWIVAILRRRKQAPEDPPKPAPAGDGPAEAAVSFSPLMVTEGAHSGQVVLVAPASWPAGISTHFDPLPGRCPALQGHIVANDKLTASEAASA